MSIDDKFILKDDRMMFSLGAGNRDPDVFECPEDFNLNRDNLNQHWHLAMVIINA